MAEHIIEVGSNCWRCERADRVAFLVDAADYFGALYAALQRAQECVWILGWDIHSKTPLVSGEKGHSPSGLADLLRNVTRRRSRLRVRILVWDPAPIYLLEREFSPLLRFSFNVGRRVELRFASDHVVGASHHQKVVVVDDRMAFVGGIDLTAGRWDTREHQPDDPRRTSPSGDRYGPFHDAQLAVDGDAARALGKLARQRWHEATGGQVDECRGADDPWPDSLEPALRHTRVAFARTQANFRDRPAIREVEQLFLDAIAAARHAIYIENQYLTSSAICEAIVKRLAEPKGPEVLIVTPSAQSGRLAEFVMGALRVRFVRRLRAADQYARLRVLCPVVEANVPVNVHAKVMVVDDQFVRIGSANLSNRSMGLDTECDAAIEADTEDTIRAAILDFRDGLLAEHLGCTVEALRSDTRRLSSLVAAVDALRGGPRSLEDLTVEPHPGESIIDPQLADPDRPLEETLARRVIIDEDIEARQRRFPRIALVTTIALLAAGVAAWWSLNGGTEAGEFVTALEPLQERAWGPPVAVVIVALAATCMLPVNALIIAVVFVFGPWVGVGVSLAGSLISAMAGYALGRVLWRDTVRRLAGRRINRLSQELGRRGVTAVVAIRLLPIAPFTIANLVAGSSRIGFRDFLLGTLIGMLPGILVFALASDRVMAAARQPSAATILQAVGAVLFLALGTYWLYGFLNRQSSRRNPADESNES